MPMDASSRTPGPVTGLDISETADGLVVYQAATDTVHHLNHTAAVVFGLCDGAKDVAAITSEVAALFSLDEPPVADVAGCIAELTELGLIR